MLMHGGWSATLHKFAVQSENAFIYLLLDTRVSVHVKCVYVPALKSCDIKRTPVNVKVNVPAVSHVRVLSTSLGTIKTELGA